MNRAVQNRPGSLRAHGSTQPGPARKVVSAQEGYRRWAPTYDSDPNPLLAREERYITPLVDGLCPKNSLDLACGTGRWLARLAEKSESAIGLDCSRAMLRIAGQKRSLMGRLTQGTCENLPFHDAVFDLVICSFALGHVQDLRLLAAELARITEVDANVFISDVHAAAYCQGWRVGFRDAIGPAEIETVYRSAEEIVSIFRDYGFRSSKVTGLRLGQPERPIFARAGKLDLFAMACRLPSVVVFHLKQLDSVASAMQKT